MSGLSSPLVLNCLLCSVTFIKDKVRMVFITEFGKDAKHMSPCFLWPTEADLRIGELQWGDSGVYFCKVVIADDLEGKNEAQLELLVLGKRFFN